MSLRRLFALLIAVLPLAAGAASNRAAEARGGPRADLTALKVAKGSVPKVRIELPAPPDSARAAVQSRNAQPGPKALQIGIGRGVAPDAPGRKAEGLEWRRTHDGWVGHWQVASAGAAAIRVALEAARLPDGTEVRLTAEDEEDVVYGPYSATTLLEQQPFWGPVIEGEAALLEVFLPAGARPQEVDLEVTTVSHLFESPVSGRYGALTGGSSACEEDAVCRTASDPALAQAARAVAGMTFTINGSSFSCTGTLLNPRGTLAPYFYSANHCIDSQATALTLTTHWFFDRAGCGSGSTLPSYTQLTGGADLLHAHNPSDVAFLRLRASPPAGAVYSAWDSAALTGGTPVVGLHHPRSDWKKVSRGAFQLFTGLGGTFPSGSFARTGWTHGVTEPGSSGSGVFTLADGQYRLRGGLWGGSSSCDMPTQPDYYSRFDLAYPALAQWLDPPPPPTCAYSVDPPTIDATADARTGSITVTTTSACPWRAVSGASWTTLSGAGTTTDAIGFGSFNYALTANPGTEARKTAIVVGSQAITVTQAGTPGGGTPTGAPAVTLSTTALDFGGQSMGTTSPLREVLVTNSGEAPLNVGSVAASAGFAQSNNCIIVAPGESCSVNVSFTPAIAAGALNATVAAAGTLSISHDAPDSPHTVSLAGAGEKSLVAHFYRAILRRAPDAGGKAHWDGEALRMQSLQASVNETWFAMAQAFFASAEYAALGRDANGYVTDLYRTFFNRAPDSGGLAFWTGLLAQGMPRDVVLVSFMISPEFSAFTQAIFGAVPARPEIDTVGDFYRGFLARLPESGGFAYWLQRFRAAQCAGAAAVTSEAGAISAAFLASGEYTQRARSNASFVGDMYNAFLRRGGDLVGVRHWIQQLDTGVLTRAQVREAFMRSPEFAARAAAVAQAGCAG